MSVGISFHETSATEGFDAQFVARRERFGRDVQPRLAMRRFARMAQRSAPTRPELRYEGEHQIARDRIGPDAAAPVDDLVQRSEDRRPRLDPFAPGFRQRAAKLLGARMEIFGCCDDRTL